MSLLSWLSLISLLHRSFLILAIVIGLQQLKGLLGLTHCTSSTDAISAMRHVYVPISLHNQKLEIRSVPAPPGQNDQTQVPTQLGEKTLRELNQMDPYEFAVSNINVSPFLYYSFYKLFTSVMCILGEWLPLHCYYWTFGSQRFVVVPILQQVQQVLCCRWCWVQVHPMFKHVVQVQVSARLANNSVCSLVSFLERMLAIPSLPFL
jgi:hypothetical protein